jgi:hypothetical protein
LPGFSLIGRRFLSVTLEFCAFLPVEKCAV